MRGAGRRRGAGRGAGNGRRKTAADGSADPKTSLVDEWRAHEEDCAARVLQTQFRAFLGRQSMARLLLSVYEKHYDPMRKQHFYVNTLTNVSTWDKPLLLVRFLPGDHEIARGHVDLAPKEAAQRIQRVVRAFLAKKTIRQLVRESYMKLFDPDNRVFYYLNTRSGQRSEQKPPFFRRRPGTAGTNSKRAISSGNNADDDLEIEPFHFRKAVCKLSSEGNPHGSGIIGRFCGILCVLADGKTLADESTARSARAVCNYADERVAFPVVLAADSFFAGIKMPEDSAARLQPLNGATYLPQPQSPQKKSHKPHFDFALCALNEDQFLLAAGANVQPLRFEMNDRKLGCGESESLRLGDHLEVVGHPHGKLQVLHPRHLAKLAPNSINPQHLQFDRGTETGSAGCGVFTRGGKLVGIQQFAGPKEPPPLWCWYIKPILNAALVLVTPPEPFILTSCVASTGVQVYWQLPRDWEPLRGHPVHYELEMCRHGTLDTLHHDPFERVYSGPKTTHHIDNLQHATMYSLRCRAVNCMKKSRWSTAVRFITLQQVSLAWRLRHCTSVKEAVKQMRRQQSDPQTQFRSVQWIYAQLEKREEADRVEWETQMDGMRGDRGKPAVSNQLNLEQELLECHGLEALLDSVAWLPNSNVTVTLILRLFLKLTRLQSSTQQFMTEASRFEVLSNLLRSQTSASETEQQAAHDDTEEKGELTQELQIPLLCLELIGLVLSENGSAKLVFEACSGVELVLSFLERELYRHEAAVVGECCYILAVFSYENASVKWRIAEANGFALFQRVLLDHWENSRILYWALITIGNVAYGLDEVTLRPQLEAEITPLGLIDSVCECRVHFLSRLHELELSLVAAQAHLDHMHSIHVGQETRNELDASTQLVETLTSVIADWKSNDVAEAADYALRYLLSEEQRRVQAASKRLMRKFLRRTLSMAMEKWCEATVYERHRAIFLMFINTVRTRQLRPAFRRWEQTAREMRKHKSILQTIGSGLAIDLAKKKKERYRMLVLQK
ncbi:thiosulfate sulfurtransferase (rhodanese)-like domain-containing protein 2 [Phytophthora pseudosyringae]|uniref:Thiosulfate sulfurtransferase (Rhodanese)-like domain-containing protein 2 n=1 Tax=Phytophthora pseudosyringae TaxID=221518 RepID=A0A8T1WG61_9STRA|nr:thiosulfate sulfurtransferase (rhodanese)-like domain-containing protein 2 [Phytophthora pseudosyringae]